MSSYNVNIVYFLQAKKNLINRKLHSESSREAPHVIIPSSATPQTNSQSQPIISKHSEVSTNQKSSPTIRAQYSQVLTNQKSPPVIPLRNGSKLESEGHKKYFDSNIQPLKSDNNIKDIGGVNEKKQELSGDVTDKSRDNNIKDLRKPRADPVTATAGQNTLVFNFVNSKKDVSHIENDGLDLTNRTKKKVSVNL